VLADLGLAIASEWMFAPELKAKTVKAVLADWSLPPVEAWAIFPAGRQASAKAKAFASFIERQSRLADSTPPVGTRIAAGSSKRTNPGGGRDRC
jgi:DNA-binding transcriptional LysR family regulator